MKAKRARALVMAHIARQCALLGINPKDYLTATTAEEQTILNIGEKGAKKR